MEVDDNDHGLNELKLTKEAKRQLNLHKYKKRNKSGLPDPSTASSQAE
ncbi:hypothetical protein Hanom_Chr02g00128701 [Helianthus anomalus]